MKTGLPNLNQDQEADRDQDHLVAHDPVPILDPDQDHQEGAARALALTMMKMAEVLQEMILEVEADQELLRTETDEADPEVAAQLLSIEMIN